MKCLEYVNKSWLNHVIRLTYVDEILQVKDIRSKMFVEYETRTICPYAANFWDIYTYIHIYTYTNIYTYICTCSTLQFSDNIFIQDAIPEKAL